MPCGVKFTTELSFSCAKGGFPSIRHNEIHDLTANLLTEVGHEVQVEPHLQPITGEQFPLASSNVNDGPRLDISVNGFWGSASASHENVKKHTYEARICEVKHATLVFSATGGMPDNACAFRKRCYVISGLKHILL